MDRKEETMADELAEAVQIIRVAYDGIEIAMKVGSDGIEAMKKVLAVLKGMLDYEKSWKNIYEKIAYERWRPSGT